HLPVMNKSNEKRTDLRKPENYFELKRDPDWVGPLKRDLIGPLFRQQSEKRFARLGSVAVNRREALPPKQWRRHAFQRASPRRAVFVRRLVSPQSNELPLALMVGRSSEHFKFVLGIVVTTELFEHSIGKK